MLELHRLNDRQREAVEAPEGPQLVVAGAGSGKTRVLTTRIAWLLSERRVLPSEILAFTFTNKAAREMKERVNTLVGENRAPHWVGTFHATGVKILRRDGAALGIDPNFTIYDTDDSTRLLKRVAADAGADPKQYPPSKLRHRISAWKNEDIDPETALADAEFWDEPPAKAYAAYEKALRANNALDFDDLILRTVHLLEQSEEVRAKYAQRFRHVLVDEFQDTNKLQLILIKALSSVHGNVFAVGDDDQSIYSWRGAQVENMLNFEEFFPGSGLVRLEQNYRSTGNILDAANAVIAHNSKRKGKNLWTAGAAGDLLQAELVGDEEDEAARVVDIVREESAKGLRRGDVTILYRTNAQSRALEEALRRAAVPYQVVGSTAFYERREIRDVLAYLKLLHNPADSVAALRVLNVPKRRIGDTSAQRLLALAEREGLTLGEAAGRPGLMETELGGAAMQKIREFFALVAQLRAMAEEMSVPDLLEALLTRVGYEAWLEQDDAETAAARLENVAELVNGAHAFHDQSDGGTLAQYLEQVALVADADTIADDQGVVRMMTVHAAKGLEFPVVAICGVEEELMPHVSNLEDASALEEERRLFYVALTRAEKRVYLLHARMRRRFGQREACLASRFLGEIPDTLMEMSGDPVQAPTLGSFLGGESWTGFGGASRGGERRAPRPSAPVRPRPQSTADLWASDVSQEEVAYRVGQTVLHPAMGQGVVARVEGSGPNLKLDVDFPGGERKHFLARLAKLRTLD
ncbi:MAG TPA: UvrD-helicase domain-containing protein [Candidatus Krumholzibacteria bacterium]|nr:UvrD-helicase domain-containing protein [Candidatus Krumholzibacteria bacterium]HRX50181.1 UvrD-helicase domain-containing protein [Candidatus Krumholzibacteria bacterium]